MSSVAFREVQRFPAWSRALVAGLAVLPVAIFGWVLALQLGQGVRFGDRPLSDAALVALTAIVTVMSLGIAVLFLGMKLIVEVRDEGLFVRFFPLRGRLIPYTELSSCEARDYRPLREFGGWGIRFGRSGKAYTASGKRGVQLELAGGKRLLLGSARAAELSALLRERISASRGPPPARTDS